MLAVLYKRTRTKLRESYSPGHTLQLAPPAADGQRGLHGVGTNPSEPGTTSAAAARSGMKRCTTVPFGNMRIEKSSRELCKL